MNQNRKRMKRKLRKSVRKVTNALNKVLTAFSVIVIVLGCAYFAVEIHAHVSINNLSNQVVDSYRQGVADTEQKNSIIPTNIAIAEDNTDVAEPVVAEANAASTPVQAETPAAAMPAMATAVDSPFNMDMPMDVAKPIEVDVFQEEFAELYSQNNDLIGYIKVNEKIEYPVVYRDNDFYMDHDYNGKYNQAGWIFLDVRNDPGFIDDNLLIYGHNMRSGTMFGDLDFYREFDYLAQRPVIELQSVWSNQVKKYVIFSMFDASMDKDDSSYIKITNFNFDDAAAKQDFIDALSERNLHKNMPVDANADDQLMILVTCSYSHDNGRFLVVARELRDGETEADMMQRFADAK